MTNPPDRASAQRAESVEAGKRGSGRQAGWMYELARRGQEKLSLENSEMK